MQYLISKSIYGPQSRVQVGYLHSFIIGCVVGGGCLEIARYRASSSSSSCIVHSPHSLPFVPRVCRCQQRALLCPPSGTAAMGQTCPQRAETKDPPGASPGGKPPPRGLLPGPAYWAMLGPYWVKVLPVAVANVMDWYEYSAYAFLSDHIATVFFHNSTTIAWLTFGLTGVMRPVGGLLFGLIADHFGRRNALVTSLYVMLASTMGIGLAPNVPYVGPTCIVLCSILSVTAPAPPPHCRPFDPHKFSSAPLKLSPIWGGGGGGWTPLERSASLPLLLPCGS